MLTNQHGISLLGPYINIYPVYPMAGRMPLLQSIVLGIIILANTAYLTRISGMSVSNGLHNTPCGHSLPTDCTVKCSCIRTLGDCPLVS